MQIVHKKQSEKLESDFISVLSRKISEGGISYRELGDILGVTHGTVENLFKKELKNQKLGLIMQLSEFLDIPRSDFFNYCLNTFNQEDILSMSDSKTVAYLVDTFDLATLKKAGFISSKNDYEKIEEEICAHFNLANIQDYDLLVEDSFLFSKSAKTIAEEKRVKMLRWWLASIKRDFVEYNNPYQYNPKALEDYVSKIPSHTIDEEKGFHAVLRALYRLGITVVITGYVPCSGINGATMLLDGKPCIAITDMGKKYYLLWRTLLHELCHVLNDYEMLESMKFHVSDQDNPDFFNEIVADNFADEMLLSSKALDKSKAHISSSVKVSLIAKKLNIHPCVIYNRYCQELPKHQQSMAYARFSSKMPGSCRTTDFILRNRIDNDVVKMESYQNQETKQAIN